LTAPASLFAASLICLTIAGANTICFTEGVSSSRRGISRLKSVPRASESTDPTKLATFKVFLMDEAWLFIRNETIRQYIVQAQKTWRKHNAAKAYRTTLQ